MAKKIGVYILAQVAKQVIIVARRNEQRIRTYGGEALWTLTEFLCAIAGILISVIEANENIEGDYQSPLSTLSSSVINQVEGAYQNFLASNGIGGGA